MDREEIVWIKVTGYNAPIEKIAEQVQAIVPNHKVIVVGPGFELISRQDLIDFLKSIVDREEDAMI